MRKITTYPFLKVYMCDIGGLALMSPNSLEESATRPQLTHCARAQHRAVAK